MVVCISTGRGYKSDKELVMERNELRRRQIDLISDTIDKLEVPFACLDAGEIPACLYQAQDLLRSWLETELCKL